MQCSLWTTGWYKLFSIAEEVWRGGNQKVSAAASHRHNTSLVHTLILDSAPPLLTSSSSTGSLSKEWVRIQLKMQLPSPCEAPTSYVGWKVLRWRVLEGSTMDIGAVTGEIYQGTWKKNHQSISWWGHVLRSAEIFFMKAAFNIHWELSPLLYHTSFPGTERYTCSN